MGVPAVGEKVPVTVLTGFLGAGKTTLMNHILKDQSHGLRFAIIENEFGDVGIDDKLVPTEEVDEEIIEVMNGCICCTVRGDLVTALKKLYNKVEKFDAVIIETTGLADPAPVAQTFFVDDDIQMKYKLDGIVTVVDAKHILPRLKEEKPEGVENESVEQVAFADRILLNKTDLVDEEELKKIEGELKAINGHAQIFRCQNSVVEPKNLINLGAFDLNRTLEMDPEFLNTDGEHEHDSSVSSISHKLAGDLNVNRLQQWIQKLIQTKSQDLFRYKGVLAVKGCADKYVFQGVHMIFSGGFMKSNQWKEGEERECRFVFIGRNLDKAAFEKDFLACEAEKTLRFQVGDAVMANVGTWKKGKVIKQWDEGNPYRIELEDGKNIWGPIDSEACVTGA